MGSLENLPFDDDSFDTVVCTHTLEHIRNIGQALKEIRRVTRKTLIVVVPKQREYKYTFDLHIHFFPYISSLHRLTGNPEGIYLELKNDIVYVENYSERGKIHE
jgi:ubiquinone/menaquinone biosynthesis C-methylase UbiE